ncbi:MAG: heme NO-binding domain-containing protein [Proteobacteria bacterium]|nr:heme NO-binding domain-containing protein [Pseudomonadota bacterium]
MALILPETLMYGMVNKAVEEMVVSRFGAEVWEKVKARADVEEEVFISNEAYPDGLTYRLVGAASAELGLNPDEVLEAFGIHWILHTAREGYGDLLAAAGSTFPEFLLSLPSFHTRLTLMFPELSPPIFNVTELDVNSLHLHYISTRPSLMSFVIGILKGLGTMFGTEIAITVLKSRTQGDDHEVFLINW